MNTIESKFNKLYNKFMGMEKLPQNERDELVRNIEDLYIKIIHKHLLKLGFEYTSKMIFIRHDMSLTITRTYYDMTIHISEENENYILCKIIDVDAVILKGEKVASCIDKESVLNYLTNELKIA